MVGVNLALGTPCIFASGKLESPYTHKSNRAFLLLNSTTGECTFRCTDLECTGQTALCGTTSSSGNKKRKSPSDADADADDDSDDDEPPPKRHLSGTVRRILKQADECTDARFAELLTLIASARQRKCKNWPDKLEAAMVQKMNDFWFVVTWNSKNSYCEKRPSDNDDDAEVMQRDRSNFLQAFENWRVPLSWLRQGVRNNDARQKLCDVWVASPQRRMFHRFVFDPTLQHSSRNYKLFSGLAIDAKAAAAAHALGAVEAAKPMLEHIRLIWCRGDAELLRKLPESCSPWLREKQQRLRLRNTSHGVAHLSVSTACLQACPPANRRAERRP